MWRVYALFTLSVASVLTTTLAQDVITITVHRTCETTSFFPTNSRVMTNGTTSPYTFPPTTSGLLTAPTSSNTATNSLASPVLQTSSANLGSSSSVSAAGFTSPIPYTSVGTTTLPVTGASSSSATSACESATPSDLSCPGADGTRYNPAVGCGYGDTFVVFCAMEFASTGLVRLEDVEYEEVCIGLCSQDVNCLAVAFDTSDNSCYEKSAVVMGTATANPNCIFAIRAADYYPSGDNTTSTSSSISNLPTSDSSPSSGPANSVSTSTSATGQLSTSAGLTSVSSSRILSTSSSPPTAFTTSVSSLVPPLYSVSSSIPTSSSGISYTPSQSMTSSFRSSLSLSAASVSTTSLPRTSSGTTTLETTTVTTLSSSSSLFSRTTTTTSTGVSSVTPAKASSTSSTGSPASAVLSVYTSNGATTSMSTITTGVTSSGEPTTLSFSTTQLISTTLSSSFAETSTTRTAVASSSSQTSASEPITSSSSSSTVTSSASSSPVPSLCPGGNLTTYKNDNVHTYTIYCDMSSPGSYRTVPAASFVDCINACDLDGSCTAVTFSDGICSFCLPPVSLTYSSGSQCAARPASVQSSSAMTTTSMTPTPSPTPAPCPDGEITTGADGRQYNISCKSNTSGDGETLETIELDAGDFTQCSHLCDVRSTYCDAWVWAAEPGQAGGVCHLKEAPQSPVPGDDGMVCGILVGSGISVTSTSFEMAMTTTASSSSVPDTTTTTTTTSSSSLIPDITTTTTTTSSSSSIPDTTTTTTTTDMTTDTTTTTTSTTTTSTSSSSSSVASPSATCAAQDKSTYQAADGSAFILLCNRGFAPNYLPGSPIQLLQPSFEACVEQCAGQGTQCAGATFGASDGSTPQCYLYSKMLQADDPSYPLVAAVRTSSATGVDGRRQIIQDGGFDESLSPWTSSTGNTGNQFTVNNHIATCAVPSDDSNTLSQHIPDPAVGNPAYYFSIDLGVYPQDGTSTSQASCQIDFQNGVGDLFYRQVLSTTDSTRTMYGSGTIQQSGMLDVIVNVQCTGSNEGVVTLDNIAFYVFQADGTPAGCSSDASILQNGGFDTAFPPWTTSQGSSTSATFSVSGGQANVQFAAGASTNDDLAKISQSASIPNNTPYRLTADLFFSITSQGSCDVSFANEFEVVYTTGQITTSQQLPVSFDGQSDIATSQFVIKITCSGPGVNRVGIDNVGLILNPGSTNACATTSTAATSATPVPVSTTSFDIATTTSSGPTVTPSCDIPATRKVDTADCPANDGAVYTTTDGAEWMHVCNLDYGGSDIQSLISATFSDCIESCKNYGIACVGISYIPDANADVYRCYIKSDMNPSIQAGYTVHSAVRVTGPLTMSSRAELLINGCFANDVSFWRGNTPDPVTDDPTPFVWDNGAADVTLALDPSSANPAQKASLSQNVTRAVAGNTWYLSVRFSTVEVDPASCHIEFGTYLELLTLRDYAQVPASGTVYASGTFQTTPIMFYMTYSCDNNGAARNVTASFDDLSLTYYYTPPV